jgi:hypothetical protein
MRDRKLWAFRRGTTNPFGPIAASRIGGENGMYELRDLSGGFRPSTVDDLWGYEMHLGAALDRLCDDTQKSLDGTTWIRTLVPFAAGVFVRTKEFDRRHDYSWLHDDEKRQRDNTNLSRATAMQRLLAPLMACWWTVFHTPPSVDIINNDRGLANFKFRKRLGWMVPLGKHEFLALEPAGDGDMRPILVDHGSGDWRTIVDHVALDEKACEGLVDAIADAAHEFIVGSDKALMETQRKGLASATEESPPNLSSLPPNDVQIIHSFDWHRAASAIQFPATHERVGAFEIDFSFLAKNGWMTPTLFPMNVPIYNVGLGKSFDTIYLRLKNMPLQF